MSWSISVGWWTKSDTRTGASFKKSDYKREDCERKCDKLWIPRCLRWWENTKHSRRCPRKVSAEKSPRRWVKREKGKWCHEVVGGNHTCPSFGRVGPSPSHIRVRLFYWNIIASQCCLSLCSSGAWISCVYVCLPSLWASPLPPTTAEGLSELLAATPWSPTATQHRPTLHLHLHACPGNRGICTISPDSTYMR